MCPNHPVNTDARGRAAQHKGRAARAGYRELLGRAMELKASNGSAALAGIWSALTLVPFDTWMEHHRSGSVLTANLLWLAGAAAFFLIPAYYFVIGRDSGPFSRLWFTDPAERTRYAVVVKRMLIWFLCTATVGVFWSLAFSYFWLRP